MISFVYVCLHPMNCLIMPLSHTILEEHAMDMDIGNDDGGDVSAVDSPLTSVYTR